MEIRPWMQAVEAQLAAFRLSDTLLREDTTGELKSGWAVDRALLVDATPYAWSRDVTQQVLAASKTIPFDTELNRWNLQTPQSWWWFEDPLPFETLSIRQTTGVRALAFGFIPLRDHPKVQLKFPTGTPIEVVEQYLTRNNLSFKFGMPVVCWIDPSEENFLKHRFTIAPSQIFEWQEGQTLGSMLAATEQYHRELYGVGGKWANRPLIGEVEYMRVTEGIARFILAGIAWLNQKLLVPREESQLRQRRKEFERATKRPAPTVRVVSLRQVERSAVDEPRAEGPKREWSCRWEVIGHWRNQVCGPKRVDRRLTWISEYEKGPKDKPLKQRPTTIYTVDR